MSSCSLSYLGGVFDRAAMILCGSDAVTDPVTGRIITPLPHDIAQSNAHVLTFEPQSIYLSSSSLFLSSLSLPSLFRSLFPPLEMRSTLVCYARVVVSIGNEGYQSSSASAVTILTLEVAE